MKHFIPNSLIVLALFCLIAFSQGCGKTEKADDHGHDHAADAHDDHAHTPKYNEVMVEFPGHKYAMEIIDENGTTGLVTAFLTDAHFEPVEVDAKEVQLNFMIAGSPKSFKLTRIPQEIGKPATFTLTDMQLATLNCEGWEGEATATVNIGGAPYTSKLVKLGHDDHDHDGHAH
jgi:hypothetical protein